jgi:hypothetical protein
MKYREERGAIFDVFQKELMLPNRIGHLIYSKVNRENPIRAEEFILLEDCLYKETAVGDDQRFLSSLISFNSSRVVVLARSFA